MVKAPEQWRNRYVEHREVITQHEFVFQEHGGQLRQTVSDVRAGFLQNLFIGLGSARFQNSDVGEQFFFKVEQEQTHAGTVNRVTRHELWMRKTLVDVFVDDVGLIQDQIALDQDRHLAIRIHHIDVFWLVVEVDIADFKVHAFFEQDKTAAMRKRTRSSRIKHHHDGCLLKIKKSDKLVCHSVR